MPEGRITMVPELDMEKKCPACNREGSPVLPGIFRESATNGYAYWTEVLDSERASLLEEVGESDDGKRLIDGLIRAVREASRYKHLAEVYGLDLSA